MDKDVALEQIFDDLIFHETLNIIFDTHRAVKKGLKRSRIYAPGPVALRTNMF